MMNVKFQTEITDVLLAHHSFYNRDYISGEDIVEREFLIRQLGEVFPQHTEEEIERALGYACRQMQPPRTTTRIMDIIQQHIGKV